MSGNRILAQVSNMVKQALIFFNLIEQRFQIRFTATSRCA